MNSSNNSDHSDKNGEKFEEAINEIIEFIITNNDNGLTPLKLDQFKRSISKKFKIEVVIKNPDIFSRFPKDKLTKEIRELLLKKPTKTLSGVTPVAVMIKPQNSCKWACIYCPFTGLAAKSYTGFEPAALRGRQFGFDPYMQSSSRVRQFEGGGHSADKCEVIVMGGTFLDMPEEYKTFFIKGIYEGLNGKRSKTLDEAIQINEKAATHKVIGLTIETRPDICVPFINDMLSYGATRVELGVQNPNDEIYKTINRGHTVKEVVDSTSKLKDSAFKVLYHLMPGLPKSDFETDLKMIQTVFEDQRFRPDMLKIYPTLVIGGTILYQMLQRGEYNPYSTEEAAEIISEFYRYIPKYVRVMRIQRDIPAPKIEEGVKKSNLRELVEAKIREKDIIPKEIRYREVGLSKKKVKLEDFELRKFDYDSSDGKENFISFENDEDLIAGFIRLRFPPKNKKNHISDYFIRKEVDEKTALIRELHVYGSEVPLAQKKEDKVQHMGLGSRLLEKAEEIAKDAHYEKILVISGVGVRDYYRKKGYERIGPYMGKIF